MNSGDSWAVRQEIAAKLNAAYPTFNVWATAKSWWATRKTPIPSNALRYGLYMTVTADSPEDLKRKIDEQLERWERFSAASV